MNGRLSKDIDTGLINYYYPDL